MTTESKKLQTIEGFTPAPWEVCEESDAFPGIEAPEIDFSVVVVGFEEDWDCGIQGHNREEQLANARLIAAAPGLYRIAHEQREVMKRLVEACDRVCNLLDDMQVGLGDAATRSSIRNARANIEAAAPFLED